ncbi:type I glyceraldehyde-3-phosphate dehydrogenase [Sulfitobacter sp. JB4-11]|uniref:type I glyceraldehyde-3-phosphate dehydrogenase n=1 Tax=Sulfitobacter rhodophyticola TaxID=3238304 RepID=UPI0035191B91
MTLKLGINGFGRIGRMVVRALVERNLKGVEVIAINDLAPPQAMAHLLEFDSVHGRFAAPVTLDGNTLDVGRGPIRLSATADPARLDWADVDIALECTGHFTKPTDAAQHLGNGSDKVLISGPGKGDVKTIVYGVNHHLITADDRVISNASCTTNCLAPVTHVLQEAYGIKRGHMTTVHSFTGTQPTHDRAQDDLYRARAATLSMVPTTTSAASALDKVLPHLAGLITSTSIRVPAPNVSCVDLVVETEKAATEAEVNAAMKTAAAGALKGVLNVTDRPLVSTDLNHDPHSATFACDQTAIQGGTLMRVLAWYDNEWGFANRMLDTAQVMAGAAP